jgi:hypothetical protein
LLALAGDHHFVDVSRIRVNTRTILAKYEKKWVSVENIWAYETTKDWRKQNNEEPDDLNCQKYFWGGGGV